MRSAPTDKKNKEKISHVRKETKIAPFSNRFLLGTKDTCFYCWICQKVDRESRTNHPLLTHLKRSARIEKKASSNRIHWIACSLNGFAQIIVIVINCILTEEVRPKHDEYRVIRLQ